MNLKSLFLFSLLFFKCMQAMESENPDQLADAQKFFIGIIQNDQLEQEKLQAIREFFEGINHNQSQNKAAILNCKYDIDQKKTAFAIALEYELYDIVEYLIQQPDFDVNQQVNIDFLYIIPKIRTPLVAIIKKINSLSLYHEDKQAAKKKLITIANKILVTHQNINTQQLFDAYKALLDLLDKSLKQDIQDLLIAIINHANFDINQVDDRSYTQLIIAALSQNPSEKVIQALIEKGADLNKKFYHYPHLLGRFFTTPQSILNVAIAENKYDAATILYNAGARTINPEIFQYLTWLKKHPSSKKETTFFNTINNPKNPQLVVNSWSSAKTSGLCAISALTILYDFMKFKKPEKVTDAKKDTKAKITEKTKTKNDLKKDLKKAKEKKELSRLERLVKHTRNYKKDLLTNPRNHKKLLIPIACLLFRLLKDPIQYRNTRFA